MSAGGALIHRNEVNDMIEHFSKLEVERNDALKKAAVKVS